MATGPFIRKTLIRVSPGLVKNITAFYRGFFVDLNKLPQYIPASKAVSLLNIGTGDGELVNLIAKAYPHLSITSTDITERHGWLIEPEVRSRISLICIPATEIEANGFGGKYDIVLLSDVLHHVIPEKRSLLLSAAWQSLANGGKLIIKDVDNHGIKALLSLWSDKYITGDKHTQLIGQEGMKELIYSVDPRAKITVTQLLHDDFPNFMLIACNS
jgi:2-polyprenyl-3-methyl-5-hydroxy-6-metoxy-1,4-benzoquinol methylase